MHFLCSTKNCFFILFLFFIYLFTGFKSSPSLISISWNLFWSGSDIPEEFSGGLEIPGEFCTGSEVPGSLFNFNLLGCCLGPSSKKGYFQLESHKKSHVPPEFRSSWKGFLKLLYSLINHAFFMVNFIIAALWGNLSAILLYSHKKEPCAIRFWKCIKGFLKLFCSLINHASFMVNFIIATLWSNHRAILLN